MFEKRRINPHTEELLRVIKTRFEQHSYRHPGLQWADVAQRLLAQPDKLESLLRMENTGGEPDVVGHDSHTGEFLFLTARPKVPKAAAASATTGKPSRPENTTNPQVRPWRWLPPWASSC